MPNATRTNGQNLIKVAVFLPLYEKDSHLWFSDSLDSIFLQLPIEPYEFHVYLGIDGPINSNHESVVTKFSDKIYCIVRSEKNNGLASNLNKLIDMLDDEVFIFRMDADDRSINERFRRQLEFFCCNPLVDIVGSSMVIIDENDNRINGLTSYPLEHEQIIGYFPFGNPIAHPVVGMRRAVLEKLGGYRVNFFPEDLDLWYRAAAAGFRFANIQEPLLEFRVAGEVAHKRGRSWAFREFKVNLHGLFHLNKLYMIGVPLMRLCVRLSPHFLINFLYKIRFRI